MKINVLYIKCKKEICVDSQTLSVNVVRTYIVLLRVMRDTKTLRELTVEVFKVTHAVAQLVEALRYKSEGRRFDSRWCNWNFSLP
jgi:hypothetical protein